MGVEGCIGSQSSLRLCSCMWTNRLYQELGFSIGVERDVELGTRSMTAKEVFSWHFGYVYILCSAQFRNLHNLEIALHILGILKLRTNLEIA